MTIWNFANEILKSEIKTILTDLNSKAIWNLEFFLWNFTNATLKAEAIQPPQNVNKSELGIWNFECWPARGLEFLSFSLPSENNRDSIKHNFKIQRQRHIANIKQVVLHALNHLRNIFGVSKFYLAPRSNSGAHFMQIEVLRILSGDQVDVMLSLRSWSHQ